MTFIPENKKRAFEEGRYSLPASPVCSAAWNDAAWVEFIDRFGEWGDGVLTQGQRFAIEAKRTGGPSNVRLRQPRGVFERRNDMASHNRETLYATLYGARRWEIK